MSVESSGRGLEAAGANAQSKGAGRLRGAPAVLLASGSLLALAAVGSEFLPALLTGVETWPGLGLQQLTGLGVAWLLAVWGVELASRCAGVADLPYAARSIKRALPDLARVAWMAVQVGALVAVFHAFKLESRAFYDSLAPLILVGFVLHELTPVAYRARFFLLLSMTCILVVLGGTDGLWLLALGSILVGLAHAPMSFGARIASIASLGAALAAFRIGVGDVPWSSAVWPILGSMFMFRLISYLYDLKHGKVGEGIAHRLGYFFLLPNVAFPLFPVVDYSAYRRGYYDTDRYAIYQKGIEWMVRGTIQLMLYRVVYQHFTLPASQVATWDQLLQHVLATFLLYIRVSGQFHLAVGILHLFGYNLPETHRGYYLASSFTDFWRRINIYWKDFMMKVVYYPTIFAMRRRGPTMAVVCATLLVFASTWAFHSYQWFWLLGRFPVEWTDGIFWGVLAVILVFNSLREAKRGRARSLSVRTITTKEHAVNALRIGATFAAMCLLWSLWMSPSVEAWLALWRTARGFSIEWGDRLVPLLLLGGMSMYAVGAALMARLRADSPGRAHAATAVVIALLFVGSLLPLGMLPGNVERVATALKSGQLNQADLTQLTRGYYEDLMDVSRFNSQLWEVYMRRGPKEDWPRLSETPAARSTGDYRELELVPGASIMYLGSQLSTNAWGMRDKEYSQAPAPGVRRIALVGASHEMGQGINDGETFEARVEDRLAQQTGDRPAVEILNFAVAGYNLSQQLVILDRIVSFQPHVIMLGVHEVDVAREIAHLLKVSKAGVDIPFEPLRRIVQEAGVGTKPDAVAEQALERRAGEIESLLYGEIVRVSRERGVLPVWLFVPLVGRETPPERLAEMTARAREAGFVLLSLEDAYTGQEPERLWLASFDDHPNARGNQLLAAELYEQMLENPIVLHGKQGARQAPARSSR